MIKLKLSREPKPPTPYELDFEAIDAYVNQVRAEDECYCSKYGGTFLCPYHDGFWDGISAAEDLYKDVQMERELGWRQRHE